VSVSSAGSDRRASLPGLSGLIAWLTRGANLPFAVGAALLAVYAAGASPYDLRMLTIAGIFAILVIGFQFIFGYAGAVSLAQSCFFGVGAYVTGVLGARYGLSSPVTFPLSMIATALLAVVVAIPVLKLEDHYFALATLAVSLLFELIATQWESVTGGTNGLSGIPSIGLFGLEVRDRFSILLIVWALVVVAMLGAWQFSRGLFGRSFHLMRASQVAASAVGLDVSRMRFVAFVLSAIYGGAAGALMAHVIRVVSPEQLSLPLMVTCLTMTVIGGQMSAPGAVLGALLITYLREWFRVLENYTLIAYGALTLAFLIAAPYGLAGAAERIRARFLPEQPLPTPAARPLAPRGDTRSDPDDPLLEVESVAKAFGGLSALEDVSLTLKAGEIVGLIGPNGSGKTTLLNIISGIYTADTGRIVLAGQDITGLEIHRIARRGVARTFQHIHLVDELSALDNIAIGGATREGVSLWHSLIAIGTDDKLSAARGKAVKAAEMLDIGEHLNTACGELAYGTRRRVEVARALAAAPALLLLDEPAAGLNESEQQDLARRIRAIADTGITVLVVEHHLGFLATLVGRLVCLDNGRIIAEGSPESVRNDPQVIEAYVGAAN
jgi:branched-chain amino acid transport system ATP-binding protein/branched-chain amino acid transport system permease protein